MYNDSNIKYSRQHIYDWMVSACLYHTHSLKSIPGSQLEVTFVAGKRSMHSGLDHYDLNAYDRKLSSEQKITCFILYCDPQELTHDPDHYDLNAGNRKVGWSRRS